MTDVEKGEVAASMPTSTTTTDQTRVRQASAVDICSEFRAQQAAQTNLESVLTPLIGVEVDHHTMPDATHFSRSCP